MAEPVVELVVVDGRPTIRGECDLSNAPSMQRWLLSFDGELDEVDLSAVTFFDSSALRVFFNVRRHRPNLRIVSPSNIVLRVLEMTGTIDLFIKPDGAR